jgi:signal transduction histidine kinase
MPPRPDRDAVLSDRLALVGRAAAGLCGLVGASSLLGWIFDVDGLRRVLPDQPAIRFNTGLSMLLVGLSWFVPRALRWLCLSIVAVIAVATLIEYAVGIRHGIDELVYTDPSGGMHPGRMAVATAVSFALLAAARASAEVGRAATARWCGVVVAVLAALSLLGNAYNVSWLYRIRPVSTIAMQIAGGLLLLGIAVVLTLPSPALNWSMVSDDAGAVLLRRVLPVALIVLPVVGAIALAGERHGLYDATATAAGIVVGSALIISGVTIAAAVRLARLDDHRTRAMGELTELKADLEQQVQERAAQLHHRHEQIAVLEDRQRIAADLHDIVIQRLFAAGMFLQGGVALLQEPETRRRVETAVEAMDAAIKDLRASIFELGGQRELVSNLRGELADVCAESSRILGFEPELVVDDPAGAADQVRDELLAVLREALANVARHARASAVQVALRAGGGLVRLTVRDDGVGMSSPRRASGTRNMTDRARQRGGECSWHPVQPHGTLVDWCVPARSSGSSA